MNWILHFCKCDNLVCFHFKKNYLKKNYFMLNNRKSNHCEFNNVDALIPQSSNYLKSYILFSCNCSFLFNFIKIISQKYDFGFQLINLIAFQKKHSIFFSIFTCIVSFFKTFLMNDITFHNYFPL